jgi:hypothetical protein
MRIKRLVTTSVLTGAVLFGTAAPAFGYDCFNGSRSGQGNTQSAAAPTWWSVPEFLAVVGFTPDQIAAVLPVVQADPRIPAGFTVFYNDHHDMELAQHMREDLAVNGVGIEHSDDYTTPVFAALFEDVMSVLSAG